LFSSPEAVRFVLLIEREGLVLKVGSFGVDGMFVCFFSSHEIFGHLLLVEREGLDFEY